MHQGKMPTLRLSDLAKMTVRRWPVIVVTAACCIAVGLLFGLTAAKTYTATASLTVSPITTNPFSSAAVNQQINITTERAILSSGEVAALAAKDLGEKVSPGTLQSNAETAAPSGSQILEVSVTLPDAQKAADQANALAKAYLQFRSEGAAEVAAGYIKQLDARIKTLSDLPAPSDSQVQQLQDLLQQRTSLVLASASPGRIIGFATVPSQQSSMGVLVFMAAGSMGGLLLGISLALLRERTDPRVRTAARQSALFENDLVILNDDDQESVRWLVRTVRRTGPKVQGGHTTFVGIIALPGSGPVGLSTWLAELTRAHKLEVMDIRGNGISQEAIDLGWPERMHPGKWDKHDVVYVEIDEKLTGTRLADLADRMDILFVAAGRMTLLKRISNTRALIQGMPAYRVNPIYYVPSARRRRRRSKVQDPAILPPEHEPSPGPEPQQAPGSVTAGENQKKKIPLRTGGIQMDAARPVPVHELGSTTKHDLSRSVLIPHRSKKGD